MRPRRPHTGPRGPRTNARGPAGAPRGRPRRSSAPASCPATGQGIEHSAPDGESGGSAPAMPARLTGRPPVGAGRSGASSAVSRASSEPSPPRPLEGAAGAAGLIQRVELAHILFGQLEVEDLRVLLDSLAVRRLRDDRKPVLNAPA